MLSTPAGELPLEEYHLRLEGRAWRILHTGAIFSVDDEQRFLGAEERLPYGIVLWPSAIALAHEVASRPMHGARVLELGAGTGLPGIVAASLGARVVQTDHHPVALGLCKRNAERNRAEVVEHRLVDWTAWEDGGAYDVVLGADILYARNMHPHLRRIFDQSLAPGGTLLLSDPFRKMGIEILEGMEADGWDISMSKWTVGITPPERDVGVFELTRG